MPMNPAHLERAKEFAKRYGGELPGSQETINELFCINTTQILRVRILGYKKEINSDEWDWYINFKSVQGVEFTSQAYKTKEEAETVAARLMIKAYLRHEASFLKEVVKEDHGKDKNSYDQNT